MGANDQLAFNTAVGRRLEAIMQELGFTTVEQLAHFIGASRSRTSNWLQGYHLIPINPHAKLLYEKCGISLGWLYLGVPDGMPTGTYVRLTAVVDGLPTPRPPHIETSADTSASVSSIRKGAETAVRSAPARKKTPAPAVTVAGAGSRPSVPKTRPRPARGR